MDSVAHGPAEAEAGYLFKYIIIMQVVVYLEAGAVPALLSNLKEAFQLTFVEQGALGALVYFWLSLTCPVAGILFRKCSVRTLLGTMLCLNSLVTLGFAFTPAGQTYLLLAARSLIGCTQAFLMIYAPVWVDQFSPPEKLTTWMSYLQASVPIGIMLGYCLGAAAEWYNSCAVFYCWRWPFITQAALCLPLSIATFFVPSHHILRSESTRVPSTGVYAGSIDINDDLIIHPAAMSSGGEGTGRSHLASVDLDSPLGVGERMSGATRSSLLGLPGDSGRAVTTSLVQNRTRTDRMNSAYVLADDQPSLRADLCALLTNSIFLSVVLSLCGFYFVVSGVQFWATDYLTTELKGDKYEVYLLFVATSATAPIFGVFFGGWIVDKMGGYKGGVQRSNAMRLNVLWGFLACCAAAPAPFINNIYVVVIVLWFLLFFGGAVLPSATGIFIAAVPYRARPLASSLSVTAFNLLGYCLSPLVSSVVMEVTESYRWGFTVTLYWSLPAMLLLLFGWYKALVNEGNDGLETGDDYGALDSPSPENSHSTRKDNCRT